MAGRRGGQRGIADEEVVVVWQHPARGPPGADSSRARIRPGPAGAGREGDAPPLWVSASQEPPARAAPPRRRGALAVHVVLIQKLHGSRLRRAAPAPRSPPYGGRSSSRSESGKPMCALGPADPRLAGMPANTVSTSGRRDRPAGPQHDSSGVVEVRRDDQQRGRVGRMAAHQRNLRPPPAPRQPAQNPGSRPSGPAGAPRTRRPAATGARRPDGRLPRGSAGSTIAGGAGASRRRSPASASTPGQTR